MYPWATPLSLRVCSFSSFCWRSTRNSSISALMTAGLIWSRVVPLGSVSRTSMKGAGLVDPVPVGILPKQDMTSWPWSGVNSTVFWFGLYEFDSV